MKEKIIKFAKEKEFVSEIIGKSVHSKHSSKDFYYLWLCEVQKWLREKCGYHIMIDITINSYWYFQIFSLNSKRNAEVTGYNEFLFKDYKEALQKGVYEGLKLI